MGSNANQGAREVVWCISGDGEYYNETDCETLDDAIAEGLRQYVSACCGNETDCFPAPFFGLDLEYAEFYIGTMTRYTPKVAAWAVIEQLQEDAYEECDEWSEGYLGRVSKEDEEELQNLLQQAFDKWEKAHNQEPWFWVVKDARRIQVADIYRLVSLKKQYGSSGTTTERLYEESFGKTSAELREQRLDHWQSILEK